MGYITFSYNLYFYWRLRKRTFGFVYDKMSLRKYMKKHQHLDITIRNIPHIIIMICLLPLYIIDYNMNIEYYDNRYYNRIISEVKAQLKRGKR